MKKHLALLMLALAGAACQPQVTQTTPATTAPEAPVSTTQPTSSAKTALLIQPSLADSLTPEMRATLRRVDLAPLFLAPEPGQSGVLDGFFGKNPQRLSLAILQATRDSRKPGLFHIAGKTRYQKQVADFTGDLQITSVADYYDQGRLLTQDESTFIQDTTAAGNGDILNARAYSASAAFKFSSKLPAAYTLNGRAALDFWATDKGKVGRLYSPCEGCVDDKSPSKGSVLLMRGKWLENNAKHEQNFLVCRDVFFVSNSLIADFGIGDRGAQVNPKYVKQGWSDYWENDEWWAASPKPSLSL
jgi:hypothetical protein